MDEQTKKYLENRRASGMSNDQIFDELLKSGWTASDANEVLGRTEVKTEQSPEAYFKGEPQVKKTKFSYFKKSDSPNFKPNQLTWIQLFLGLDIAYSIFGIWKAINEINLSIELYELEQSLGISDPSISASDAGHLLMTIVIIIFSIVILIDLIAIIGIQKRKKWAFYLTATITILAFIFNLISLDIPALAINVVILVLLFKSKSYFD